MSGRGLGWSAVVVAGGIVAFTLVFRIAGSMGLANDAAPEAAFGFFDDHPAILLAMVLISYVMHLAVVVLAVGLYRRLARAGGELAAIGTILGIAWAILDIGQSTISYWAIAAGSSGDPAAVDVVAKGLQGAGHLFGGLWVLVTVALAGGLLGRAHRAFGVVAGAVFAVHPLVVPAMPAWFMVEFVALPIWFGWTGIRLLRGALPEPVRPGEPAVAAAAV